MENPASFQEITCLKAFTAMAVFASVSLPYPLLRTTLLRAAIPPDAPACEWHEGLERALTLITKGK